MMSCQQVILSNNRDRYEQEPSETATRSEVLSGNAALGEEMGEKLDPECPFTLATHCLCPVSSSGGPEGAEDVGCRWGDDAAEDTCRAEAAEHSQLLKIMEELVTEETAKRIIYSEKVEDACFEYRPRGTDGATGKTSPEAALAARIQTQRRTTLVQQVRREMAEVVSELKKRREIDLDWTATDKHVREPVEKIMSLPGIIEDYETGLYSAFAINLLHH